MTNSSKIISVSSPEEYLISSAEGNRKFKGIVIELLVAMGKQQLKIF